MTVVRSDAPFYLPLRGSIAPQNGSGSATFTRATAASIIDSATGLATTVTAGNPRVDSVLGVYLDSTAHTNNMLYCRDFLSSGTSNGGANPESPKSWIASTSGSEFVSNGVPDGTTTGWTPSDATLSIVSGKLQVQSIVDYGYALTALTGLSVGKTYVVSVDFTKSGGNAYVAVTNSGGSSPIAGKVLNNSGNTKFLFVADATTKYLRLQVNNTIASDTAQFYNISCKKSTIDVSVNQTGIDGTANSCSLLECTTANGTILQTITAAAVAASTGFRVKRHTGTGTIEITRDGGSNWTDITSQINSGTFALCKIENTSVTNPSVGFRMGTVGDKIIVDAGINHTGAELSPMPIFTTTASVTVNAETLTYQTSGNFSDTDGTILATVTRDNWTSGNGVVVGKSGSGLSTSSSNSGAQALDGANTVNGPSGTPSGTMKIGTRWSGSSLQAFSGGSFGSSGSYDGAFGLSTIAIMPGTTGYIKDVAIWPSSLSDADMISASDSIVFNLVNGSAAALSIAAQNGFEITGRTIDASIAALSFTSQNGLEIIGRTIDASITPLEFSMIDGNVIMGRTIDGDIINLSLDDQDGQMIIGRTISGEIAPIAIITKADSMVLLDDSPRSAVTIAATLASPTITARL